MVPPAVLVDMALFSSASIAESSLPRIRFNSSDAPACISWLYDVQGANFLQTMLRLAKAHGSLSVVNDQHGVPTAAPLLAQALVEVAKLGKDMPQGIWHHSHQGHTTWHGFASAIMEVAGLAVPVLPVDTSAFPTAAPRPAWSVLDGEPLRARMGWPSVTWREALEACWSFRNDA